MNLRNNEEITAKEVDHTGAAIYHTERPGYIVLDCATVRILQATVQEYMDKGWTPIGGVSHYESTNSLNSTVRGYAQAMIGKIRDKIKEKTTP